MSDSGFWDGAHQAMMARMPQGDPSQDQPDLMQLLAQIQQQQQTGFQSIAQAMMQMDNENKQAFAAIGQAVQQLVEHVKAPRSVVRDKDGRVIGAKIGG